uniref:Uncharacterized protein n=1 Tax=Oryza sativa subsp. japonica TaxID=39947 RepID=Q6ZLG7_ORYSJ|nr:hypothetical protein [Oryza sativa Japonica Group]
MKELTQHVVGAQQKGDCSQAQMESVHRLVEEDRIKAIQILQDSQLALALQEEDIKGHLNEDKGCDENQTALLILKDDDKMVSQEVSTAKEVQRSQLVASSEDDIEGEGEEGKV